MLGNCVSSVCRSSPRLGPGSGSLLHAGVGFLVSTSRWALRQPMRGSNEDGSPVGVHAYAVPTPTSFAEIVSDDFPVLQRLLLPLSYLIISTGAKVGIASLWRNCQLRRP
jgi:hypothetical protein